MSAFNIFGLVLLLLTSAGVAQMFVFFLSTAEKARLNNLPFTAAALRGAAWFGAAHVLAAIPYTIRVIETAAWAQSFDLFFFATRMAYVSGIVLLMEPFRRRFGFQPKPYYLCVTTAYGAWVSAWLLSM